MCIYIKNCTVSKLAAVFNSDSKGETLFAEFRWCVIAGASENDNRRLLCLYCHTILLQ